MTNILTPPLYSNQEALNLILKKLNGDNTLTLTQPMYSTQECYNLIIKKIQSLNLVVINPLYSEQECVNLWIRFISGLVGEIITNPLYSIQDGLNIISNYYINSVFSTNLILPLYSIQEALNLILSNISINVETTLTDNLISYWKLDELLDSDTRLDSVSTNHLSPTNNPIAISAKINNGVNLIGLSANTLSKTSNSEIQVGDIDFTFSCWVYPNTLDTVYYLNKSSGLNGIEYRVIVNNTGLLQFRIGNGVTQNIVSSSHTVVTSNWIFIVVSHDSVNNKLTIEVNNSITDFINTTIVPVTNVSSLQICPNATNHDTIIDEVGFWKRLLTADEKTTLYNGGDGLSYPFI